MEEKIILRFSYAKLFGIHLLIWLLAELFVNPIGNFPLNDDWAYGQNVYFLSEEGRIDFSDWPAMTLIVQVLWGTVFCKIFGFSFTVLRLSTIALGVWSSWIAFLFFKHYTNNWKLAYGGTLLLIFNPLFFCLANSFMTEVPFLALFLPGVYYFVKFLDDPENQFANKYWTGGLVFSLLATMIRQTGLLLPLSFGVAFMILNFRKITVKKLFLSIVPIVVALGSYLWYTSWLKASQQLSPTYGQFHMLFRPFTDGTIDYRLISRFNWLLFHIGCFMLPLTVFFLGQFWKKSTIIQRKIYFVLSVLLTLYVYMKFKHIPIGNVMGNFRLGPKTLYTDKGWDYLFEFSLSDASWLVIKIAGIFGGIMLVLEMLASIIATRRSSILFLLMFIGSYVAYVILNPFLFDRYALVLLPIVVACLFSVVRPIHKKGVWQVLGVSLFVLICWFSVFGTHDYLEWNRVRWDLCNKLNIEKKISPERLLGGFEYQGWYSRPELYPPSESNDTTDTTLYALAFEPFLCGWKQLSEHPYPRYLPPGTGHLYLHKKSNGATTTSFFCDSEKTANNKGDLHTSKQDILLKNRAPLDSTTALSGKYSIRLDAETAFSYSYTTTVKKNCHRIAASVWRKGEDKIPVVSKKRPATIVVKADDLHYHHIRVIERRSDGWEKIGCELQLQGNTEADQVKVYLWNSSGQTQWFDDFEVIETFD